MSGTRFSNDFWLALTAFALCAINLYGNIMGLLFFQERSAWYAERSILSFESIASIVLLLASTIILVMMVRIELRARRLEELE